jgi:uncharacterized Fe-S cluster protein YjdI/CDGSH-type Zn-finger protein
MATRDYQGRDIVIHWDSERCLHSGRCFGGAPAVFDPKARPWADPDGAPADEVARVVDTCPSGALTYTRLDGGAHGGRGYEAGADPGPALAADEVPVATPSPAAAGPEPDGEGRTVITPRANGPLVVEGPLCLTAADGTVTTAERLFLCRCGGSGTKPLCDGTHKRSGFTAAGVPPTSRTA